MEQSALLETLKEEEKLLMDTSAKLEMQLRCLKTEEFALREMLIASRMRLGNDHQDDSSISIARPEVTTYGPTSPDIVSYSSTDGMEEIHDNPAAVNRKPLPNLLQTFNSDMNVAEEESEDELIINL